MGLAPVSSYDSVLASSGSGIPAKARTTVAATEQYTQTKTPMPGMCLGRQALVEVFGGVVSRAPTLIHGKTPAIRHSDGGLFEGFLSPLMVGRHHSLAAESDIVRELVTTVRTGDGIVMGIEHVELPLWGVQSHPESVLIQSGHRILVN